MAIDELKARMDWKCLKGRIEVTIEVKTRKDLEKRLAQIAAQICSQNKDVYKTKYESTRWDGEHCRWCLKEQRLAWSVKDEVWKKVMQPDTSLVVCLECFLKKADEKSVQVYSDDFIYLGWVGQNIVGDLIIGKG